MVDKWEVKSMMKWYNDKVLTFTQLAVWSVAVEWRAGGGGFQAGYTVFGA